MRIGKHKFIYQSPIVIKIQFPWMHYIVHRGASKPFRWRKRMKQEIKKGELVKGVKEIIYGTGLSLKDAKELFDKKYRKFYIKK